MTERLEREERERVAVEKERIERDRAYELEKLRLQVESQKLEQTSGLELLPADQQATFNLKKLLPDFYPQDGDMAVFLNLFEHQMKILKIDFLRAAGIVLDLQKGLWYFSEAPHQSFNFIEPPADIKSLLVVLVASHPYHFEKMRVPISRTNNGRNLIPPKKGVCLSESIDEEACVCDKNLNDAFPDVTKIA
ncbi:hypothetical protein HNY73_011516 [Argiope bruennichi]|uniref:Uncharacterized protein n=1 Tax=Argiope bruennichi TaxID=94029 RepID=A0A8T0F9H2_ARGBR|nr:hypothetical protein HNY73_011516 [Argiope bruennichi]